MDWNDFLTLFNTAGTVTEIAVLILFAERMSAFYRWLRRKLR